MNSLETERKIRALKIYQVLEKIYPDAKPLLNYETPFQLLIGTILAAQCTDVQVNKVTPVLFEQFADPHTMICANVNELEEIIRSTGFYKNKTRNIKKLCFALVDKYNGQLPETIEELIKLPGIGRKTANVLAGYCFKKPAIIVDTHFKRVIGRLELATSDKPDKIEFEMRAIIPEDLQTNFSGVINYHGRYRCKARTPLCRECEIESFCPYPQKLL